MNKKKKITDIYFPRISISNFDLNDIKNWFSQVENIEILKQSHHYHRAVVLKANNELLCNLSPIIPENSYLICIFNSDDNCIENGVIVEACEVSDNLQELFKGTDMVVIS